MRNLNTYLKDKGSISFTTLPFNEVDSLLLCQLSYLNFDNLLQSNSTTYFFDVFQKKNIEELAINTLFPIKNIKLLPWLNIAERFKYVRIGEMENRLDYDKVVQFFAITFVFSDFIYIAYRGTDITFVGWREDFNMAFMDAVPSQTEALDYLERIADAYPDKMIYVGGHSKGGNLALYAAMHTTYDIKDRIISIYNFDGPGFNDDINLMPEYKTVKEKHLKYSTRSALIGVMMYHVENINYVKAKSVYIFQHDPFNWKIDKNCHFLRSKNRTLNSRLMSYSVRRFLEDTTDEEREEYINLLFKILIDNPKAVVYDVLKKPIRFIFTMFKHYRGLSRPEKKRFKHISRKFIVAIHHAFRYKVKRRIRKIFKIEGNM